MGAFDDQVGKKPEPSPKAVEPPVDQWQAMALLQAAGKNGDQAGFKPVSFDLGILGGAAAGAFTAQQILKERQHRLPVPPNAAASEVTDTGAKIWKDSAGHPTFVEVASGEGYRFKYKNNHLSQVTLPDGSYYSNNAKLKKIDANDKSFDQSDDQPWTLHSEVDKSLLAKRETMNVSVDEHGSVHFKHRNKAEEIFTSTGFEVDLNPDREIYKVTQNRGDQWSFDYTPDHELSRISKQTPSEREAKEKGEVYAPTDKLGLWSESTMPGGPTSDIRNVAVRDPETGNVMLATPQRAIVFTEGGKSEAGWDQLPKHKTAPLPTT